MVPAKFREAASCVALVAALVITPLLWRPLLATWGPTGNRFVPSYLPALEPSRERGPFNAAPIAELKDLSPGYVVIGDSMAGRVDPNRLTALTGEATGTIVQNATGPGYWYLALKNYVVASGIHPKQVFVFFRDTNLTDVLFRLDGAYRFHLDEIAGDREDELNRVVAARMSKSWYGLDQWIDRVYDVERAREWIDHVVTRWPARVIGGLDRQELLLARANRAFALDRLRDVDQGDMATAEDRAADFDANVPVSPLPLFLALAQEHDVHLCFVRVLPRPSNGVAPPESDAIRHYVEHLRSYLASHGADFIDDRDDLELARLPYGEGDHIAESARDAYTTRFSAKIRAHSP